MKGIYPKIGLKPLYILIAALVLVAGTVTAATIYILYGAAFEEEKVRLVEEVQSQARMIEAVARFDRGHFNNVPHDNPFEATLSQVREAHANFTGFAETGEFTLAHRVEDKIVFLLRHRHYDMDMPKPVPFDAELAENPCAAR